MGTTPYPRASPARSRYLDTKLIRVERHHSQNYGGHVLHNLIGPGQFGYGITLSGVDNFTVLGNSVAPHTRFAGSTHRFYPATINAPPSAFVRQWVDRGRVLNSEVQHEFVEGELQWVIGIEPDVGDKLEYEAGQVSLDVRGMSRAGEGGLAMRGARWEVSTRGELVLRKVEGKVDQFGQGEYGKGRVVWSSGRAVGDGTVEEPRLDFLVDGRVMLRSRGGKGDVLWDPTSYLTPYLSHLPPPPTLPPPTSPQSPEKWLAHPKLIFQNSQPYIEVKNHEGNLVFSTRYEWGNEEQWTLRAGQWIAIAPRELRGADDPTGFEEEERPASPPPPQPRPDEQPREGHARGGHFSRFVRDLNSTLESHGVRVPIPSLSPRGPPPPIPPRPTITPASQRNWIPTFLYLSPSTSQLILHSSPSGPTSPSPSSTHFTFPPSPPSPPPSRPADSFLAFQGDGNLVLYTSDGPVWASGTNGERQARKVVLRGFGEDERGPGLEMCDERGEVVWSSRG